MQAIFSWISLIAWVAAIRFLYPLPSSGARDLAIWAVYAIMISLGLYASRKLSSSYSRGGFVFLTVSAAMYLLLRTAYYDSIIYASLIDAMFDVGDGGNLRLLLGGDMAHVVQILIYSFVVPLALVISWVGTLCLRLVRQT